ncbi:hypothetical protein HPB52_008920 [Rhipicephalus sanguineus]|uniref:Uncharacterized protein n=1 Tax=Rhipicephalus sanguineus TaxID=34632 RepID=A0A9D4SZU4_RHISA|nr:hypothetical protein HPB52_008920 [Rhipicephalus sanguineus]
MRHIHNRAPRRPQPRAPSGRRMPPNQSDRACSSLTSPAVTLGWDVYNVRAIVDTSVSLQLLMDANAIVNLRGTVVAVNWNEGEPAADAELLDFGK